MKQQQASGRFLGAWANFCCRFCDAGPINYADLSWDTVVHGQYHYQVSNIRKKSTLISDKAKREYFLSKHSLKLEIPALQSLTPSLDLIMGCSPDLAHSEYYGLVQKLYPLFNSKILTKHAAAEFAIVVHSFVFPPGWGQIQSPATHMLSWNMSKYGHTSIIVPILLRCWLKNHHICTSYSSELQAAFWNKKSFSSFSHVDLIVFGFGKLAKSNSMISYFHHSTEDCQAFHNHVLIACRCFLGFMNAAGNLKMGKSRRRQKRGRKKQISQTNKRLSPAGSPSRVSIDSQNDDNQSVNSESGMNQSTGEDIGGSSILSTKAGKDSDKLPNFHIGIHFDWVSREYAHIWNRNVMWGENQHRIFKEAVFAMNHWQPEKQLLIKESVLYTVKAIVNGSFFHIDMNITGQTERLRRLCSRLLESLALLTLLNEDISDPDLFMFQSHNWIAVRDKLK